MNNEHVLTRLAQHRERLAQAGNIATARYDKEQRGAITREIEAYWADMTRYFDQEHDG